MEVQTEHLAVFCFGTQNSDFQLFNLLLKCRKNMRTETSIFPFEKTCRLQRVTETLFRDEKGSITVFAAAQRTEKLPKNQQCS